MIDLDTVSIALGWSYFALWSASFYPQIISNWRTKNVSGLSIDFCVLNVYGATAYGIFTCYRFFVSTDSLVQVNDVGFALHAWFMTVITVLQWVIYRSRAPFKLNPFVILYICATSVAVIVWSIVGAFVDGQTIILLACVSYIKLGCSFIKWLPQIYLNYSRKSTAGWSIGNILLDFCGGLLSIAQMFVDADRTDNWNGLLTDAVKWILGLVSMSFDCIFMVQHYVLYRHTRKYLPIADISDIDDHDRSDRTEV